MQRKKSLVYLKNIILFAFSSGFCFVVVVVLVSASVFVVRLNSKS